MKFLNFIYAIFLYIDCVAVYFSYFVLVYLNGNGKF